MSVINKMLKDLDKRQQPHGIESMAQRQNTLLPPRQSKLPLGVVSLLSLIFGGVIVFFVIETSNSDALEHVITAEQKLASAPMPLSQVDNHKIALTSHNVAADTQKVLDDTVVLSSVTPASINTHQQVIKPARSEKMNKIADDNTAENNRKETVLPAPKTNITANINAKVPSDGVNVTRQLVDPKPSSMSIEPAKKRTRSAYSSGNMAIKEVKLTALQLAQKQLGLASDAQQQGLHSDALTYYMAALSYDPALHQARKQAAALYYGQNKLSESAELLKQGQLLFPKEYEYSLLLARVQQAAGQNKAALKSLAQIPDSSILAVKKWHQQSDLAQKEQNFPVAEQSFRELAKNEPSQGRWWMGLGYALDAQKKYTEAKSAYNQALAQGNLSSQAQAYVDNRLVQLGAFQ